MKLTRLGRNSFQLTFLGFSNCYLVRESQGFTLIDATIGGCAEKILEAARHSGGDVCRILLTHAHSDHIGSLDKLHSLLGTVDVAISQREAPFLHKDLSLRPGEPQQKPRGGFPGAKTHPTHTVTDGELFGSLRCIATPGHTPGHFSFLDERDGILYTGDAMQSIGGLSTVTDTPWWFPLPKLATWDKPLALASATRLAQLEGVTGIATGHGPYIPANPTSLADAVARASS